MPRNVNWSNMGKRFLISRLSALGDVVCSLPVASALKNAFPDCEITWVCDPRFSAIVERCDAVDHVIKIKPGFSPKSWGYFEGNFDAALDLQGLLKSALPVAKCKAKIKVGYHWQREGAWLFSHRVLPDPTSFHIVDQYVDVARAVGGISNGAEFSLAPTEEDFASLQGKKADYNLSENYVVLNAGAGWVTKRWPAQHFARLADHLAEIGLQSVLIGGKAEADIAAGNEVTAQSNNGIINLIGKTNLGELLALIHGCVAHVGGDTGSTHMAAALNRPAIGLYSITRPQRSCPYGQICNCLHDPDGLANISVDSVLETLRATIGK